MSDSTQIKASVPKKTELLPLKEIKNISLFYLLTVFNNGWFIAGNWIFFWTRFMTYGKLGIVDATAFAVGLLMEIPSGAISDLIGKKKTIMASMFLAAISILGISVSSDLQQIWIFFIVAQVGWALYSGAAEALAYDTLIDHGKEDRYEEVISTSGVIATLTFVVTALVGAVLYVENFRLPHVAWGLAYLVAFFISFYLKEPKTDSEKFSLKVYGKQLVLGTKELFKPVLRPFIVVIFSLMGMDYLFNWGLVKPAIAVSFGFFDKEQAILFAAVTLIGAVVVKFIPKYRKHVSDKKGLYILSLMMSAGFLLAFFPLGYFGVFSILFIMISGQLAYPWISIVINKEISSRYRATTLSTVAMLAKLPYAVLAILAGFMVENGTFKFFNLGVGLVIVVAVVVSSLRRVRG